MRTLQEVLQLSTEFLMQKGIKHPRREAQDMLCDALNFTRTQLYVEHERPLTTQELDLLRVRLARRAKGEPSSYIHGEVSFYDCRLIVNKDVLIPRQETEILTDKLVKTIEKDDYAGKIFWDLCCGSGCIGIAVKKRLPALQVVLADISPQALAVAKQNALKNNVEVDCLLGDLLAPFKGRRTSYFVCNPPYISEEDYLHLEKEVREHEPRQALVASNQGFAIYEQLAQELPAYLEPGAKGWMEIGAGQGNQILSLYQQSLWNKRRIEQDWAGHDRFFFLEIE